VPAHKAPASVEGDSSNYDSGVGNFERVQKVKVLDQENSAGWRRRFK
jgi:hypothetical protein